MFKNQEEVDEVYVDRPVATPPTYTYRYLFFYFIGEWLHFAPG
jgi:hypothetical protein